MWLFQGTDDIKKLVPEESFLVDDKKWDLHQIANS